MRQRISALIIRDKKILLVSDDGSWYWTPGGRLEEGEDDKTTLFRELEEELGIVPTKYEFYIKYQYPAGEKTAKFVVPEGEETNYLVEVDGDIIPAAEIKIIKWVTAEEAMQMPLLNTFKESVIIKLTKDGLL